MLASIHWLTLSKKNVTQILLSAHTKIDPMSTSTVLRSLQEKGLLKRQEHETDTRAKTVSLTDKGVKLINQAVKTVEQYDDQFFSPLGKQKKEFNKNLADLLSGNIQET
jgi:DNA-binding MarR family transcriptional regulator